MMGEQILEESEEFALRGQLVIGLQSPGERFSYR